MASCIESDEELDQLVRGSTETFNRADVDAYLERDRKLLFLQAFGDHAEAERFAREMAESGERSQ